MKTLEDDLKAQPRRALPTAWRDEILDNAAGNLAEQPEKTLLAWLMPRRLCLGLAAVWAVILVLHGTTPRAPQSTPAVVLEKEPPTRLKWAAYTPSHWHQLQHLDLDHEFEF